MSYDPLSRLLSDKLYLPLLVITAHKERHVTGTGEATDTLTGCETRDDGCLISLADLEMTLLADSFRYSSARREIRLIPGTVTTAEK